MSRNEGLSEEVRDTQREARRQSHNFSAGPAALPTAVLEKVQRELLSHQGSGVGLMEMSHRDEKGPVQNAMVRMEELLRRLLKVPNNYRVLLLHGGAHGQFAALPLNLLSPKGQAAYVHTGFWSERAHNEGKKFGQTFPSADAKSCDGLAIPDPKTWDVPSDAEYLHICANETIHGIEFHEDPAVRSDVPLCADFTSTLLSWPIDVERYGVIYASSGKNLGPAGVTVVVVRDDLLETRKARRDTPSILNWAEAAGTKPISSLYNTPPTFTIYMCTLVLEDLLARGGAVQMQERATKHASELYRLIDGSGGFYTNHINPSARSKMNIPFRIQDGDVVLEKRFAVEASEHGLHQTFRHPLFGGQRITLYNSIPDEAFAAVGQFMDRFARVHAKKSA